MVGLESSERFLLKLGVGTVVWRKDQNGNREFLLGVRNTVPEGKLSLPGGTKDDIAVGVVKKADKNIKKTAIREIYEETGIDINEDRLSIISLDDSNVSEMGYLNFGCAVEVNASVEPDMSKASHAYEFKEWKWFQVGKNKSGENIFFSNDGDIVTEDDIFKPCIPTIRSFLENKLQVK